MMTAGDAAMNIPMTTILDVYEKKWLQSDPETDEVSIVVYQVTSLINLTVFASQWATNCFWNCLPVDQARLGCNGDIILLQNIKNRPVMVFA